MALLTLRPKKKKTRLVLPKPPAPQVFVPEMVPGRHPVPVRLIQMLDGLRLKSLLVETGKRAAQCLGAALMLLPVQMFVDWLVNLTLLDRALILAAEIFLLVFFLRKKFLPVVLHPPNLEACALMVEKHWPMLRGRIIATVQLARPHFTADSPQLVYALQQETMAKVVPLNFGRIVPVNSLLRYFAGVLTLAGIATYLMILFHPGSLALLERVFLLPAKVPRKTEVICLSGDKTVPVGESVLLEAQAIGIVPSHGRLTIEDDTGKIQEITLDPEPNHPSLFSLKIDSVQQPLTYTIRLNDGTSDPYRVTIIPRPSITSIDCLQVYPAYTGLNPVKRAVENLALLAGSRLQIHAIANGKIVKASLKLAGIDQVSPLKIGGAGDNELTGEIPIPASGLTGFSILLTNEAGVTSGDDTLYRVDLILDHPPTVQLTFPEQLEELDTLKAKPKISFEASDDFGLAKVALLYRVLQMPDTEITDASAPPPPVGKPTRIAMELGTGLPLNAKGSYTLDLAAIQPTLTDGETVEYWMEAQDANNVTGPGVSESEHHTFKIVSDAEKKAEIMNRLDDDLSVLQDILRIQTTMNHELTDAFQSKNKSPNPPPPQNQSPAPPNK